MHSETRSLHIREVGPEAGQHFGHRIDEEPEKTIRVLGERVIPALG